MTRRAGVLDAARRQPAWHALRRAGARGRAALAASGIARAQSRAALALRALPHRRGARADDARLRAALDALPPPPPLLRTVSFIDAADPVAAARAAAAADGELLCFLPPTSEPAEAGWLARLAAVVTGGVAAATPLLVHPRRAPGTATPYDARVRQLGLAVEARDGAPVAIAPGAGTVAAPGAEPAPVMAAPAACMLVSRDAYITAGGLEPDADADVAMLGLGRRLCALGRAVVGVPAAVVVDHRPVTSRRALIEPIPHDGAAWRALVDVAGPELLRAVAPLRPGRLRFALTVAAPSAKVAPRWGDWHLAEALARALRRLDHVVRVQTLDHADDLASRACDVHIVLRGLAPVHRTPGQRHVLWIISHPDTVTDAECDAADLVLVASRRFADALRARTTTPVEVMLQATDARRFRRVAADPRDAHELAIVAKSRDVRRAAVADALAAGLRPAIYGSGWEPYVDAELLVRDYVPNQDLPALYSSIGVLLNDHWATMREWGFVSNRLFDALACETPVISDAMPEIDELFDGAVLTYRDPAELRELVEATRADVPAARVRAEAGAQIVRAAHTMDHRARELIDALARHDLA